MERPAEHTNAELLRHAITENRRLTSRSGMKTPILQRGPMEHYKFSIPLSVRVNDLNYGNHVGYQNYFTYFQEARVAYLGQFGYTELDIEGYGMIVGEANCKYNRELLLNDQIVVSCRISAIQSKRFVMEYQISKEGKNCAQGFTRIFCYDYQTRETTRLPEEFIKAVQLYEGTDV